MTARERKASEGASATATAPPAVLVPVPRPARNGAEPAAGQLPCWEAWFQNASAVQRTEMLALAARQGVLYAHQLPPPATGVKQKPPAEDAQHVQVLTRLVAGKTDGLDPVAVQPLTYI